MARIRTRWTPDGGAEQVSLSTAEEAARDLDEANANLELAALALVEFKSLREADLLVYERLGEILFILGKEILAINNQIGRTPSAKFINLKNKFLELEATHPNPST